MKVLMFNGSPRANGCTFTALSEIASVLNAQGIETEILQIGNKPVQDCIGCNSCANKGECVFSNDPINEWIEKAKSADGFVFGTPVYYAHPSGRILSAMDRLFYAGGSNFEHKPATVVASARRAGTTATLDTLSKYFAIAQMPVISSTYWNIVHGNTPEQTKQDLEGMQTMRNIGANMAWILKCIQAGKQSGISAPKAETSAWTNFIR
ncbi:MAG: flavodoxin family protein [Clostridia bacterium]|nr:flavodoxin family protein [Clostridia bacterium]